MRRSDTDGRPLSMRRQEHSAGGRWEALLADFTPGRLTGTMATGLVLGLVNTLLTIALMTLIFRGPLEEALHLGIGAGLTASALMGLVIGLMSGFRGLHAGVQDNSAAILGLATAAIASSVVGPELVDTAFALIAITSLSTGLTFLAIGTLRLGEMASFVPFPVIAGLLAGTGYLIVEGALDILGAGRGFDEMLGAGSAGLLFPGIVVAGALFLASRRAWSPMAYFSLMTVAIAGFHGVTRISGVDMATSLSRGWLLGPFGSGSLSPQLVTGALAGADWNAVAGQAAGLITILLIAPVTVLLYTSALEAETQVDLDVNVELRSTGWANVAASVVGGPPGYVYLADTLIAYKMIGLRRGGVIVAALAMFGVVLVGGSVLELLPQFVVGGFLLFIGVEFLYEWLWKSRRRLSYLDYALMLGIVVLVAIVGFLPGVGAGLIAAIGLFVYRYSRIAVIKHSLTGREHHSNTERPADHTEFLEQNGDAILVLELQGFVFFGTANRIFKVIRSSLDTKEALRFVLLDFRLVSGVDSSAIALFERVAFLAREGGMSLLLTGLDPPIRAQLTEFFEGNADVVKDEPDLDRGLQQCEDHLLEQFKARAGRSRAFPDGLIDRLSTYISTRTIRAGERLMKQGDSAPGIFFIRAGNATVLLETSDGEDVRLRKLREGTVLGEISLYRREPTTATVIAETDCEVLHLTGESFDNLCREDPAAAAELHAFVARTLAGRLSHANRTIRALND